MTKNKAIIAKKTFLLYVILVENRVLDYKSILQDCGVGREPSQVVIKNITNLDEFYDSTELVCIYNYFLMNIINI